MVLEKQIDETLEWHVICGAPYLVHEYKKGIFGVVGRTATVIKDGQSFINCAYNSNFAGLRFGIDIEEVKPENTQMGILVNCDRKTDLKVVRGLRHLARLERTLYVAYQLIGEEQLFGVDVPLLQDRTVVLARFFNKKYESSN